ncbi:MAG: ferrous iron transport protein B [Phycisphaerae bacterium]|jgi:ferrous iron transport protein B
MLESPSRSSRPESGLTDDHSQRRPIVALVGNPNTGKTSLFNALTGFKRHVANYPGITVELARGPLAGAARRIELIDLPGTYSLAALSPDEMLVNDALAGRLADLERPDLILAVVDASNLPRNLYLFSQLRELGIPLLLALNMFDVAQARGIEIDCDRLARRLGVEVVPVVATRVETTRPLAAALDRALARAQGSVEPAPPVGFPEELHAAIRNAAALLPCEMRRSEAIRVLLDESGQAEQRFVEFGGNVAALQSLREKLKAAGVEGQRVEVHARYAWVGRTLDGVLRQADRPRSTKSDRIDRILTHKLTGGVILAAVLFTVFQAIFTWAGPLMDAIDAGFGVLADWVGPLLPEGVLRSLVVDGVIAGVGGVLTFLPQIMILFAFIAILEDCGYLARAAYMMDRVMRGLGLSGRAFIPLLSSFACAVPAIMGTRTIADRRERFVTILLAPFMSCSARLPVYVLMISAFVPDRAFLGGWVSLQALVMLGAYLVGVVTAIPLAWLLRFTAFRGAASAFVLELPSYRVPHPRAVWQRMYFAGRSFVVRAGTIILVVNLVVWALGYFPRSETTRAAVERAAAVERWSGQRLEAELAGSYLRDSYLGRIGHAIEPAVAPIGWDWRIAMATLASFPAREVIIATLGTIYNLGSAAADERSAPLREAIRAATWPDGRPVFDLPVALSIMVFYALCAQCASTLVVMGRETGTWLWPLASFVTMTSLAYVAALATSAITRAVVASV